MDRSLSAGHEERGNSGRNVSVLCRRRRWISQRLSFDRNPRSERDVHRGDNPLQRQRRLLSRADGGDQCGVHLERPITWTFPRPAALCGSRGAALSIYLRTSSAYRDFWRRRHLRNRLRAALRPERGKDHEGLLSRVLLDCGSEGSSGSSARSESLQGLPAERLEPRLRCQSPLASSSIGLGILEM